MAICLACGNSIGNGTRCAKCGSTRLGSVDPLVTGNTGAPDKPGITAPLPDQPSGNWDEALVQLAKEPSAASMREVKRQGRRRRIRSWWPF